MLQIARDRELDIPGVIHAENGEARVMPAAGNRTFALPVIARFHARQVFGSHRHERADRFFFGGELRHVGRAQRARRLDAHGSLPLATLVDDFIDVHVHQMLRGAADEIDRDGCPPGDAAARRDDRILHLAGGSVGLRRHDGQ
jgi:hypothetical protein